MSARHPPYEHYLAATATGFADNSLGSTLMTGCSLNLMIWHLGVLAFHSDALMFEAARVLEFSLIKYGFHSSLS